MEFYPAELISPAVPLVALIGCSELHMLLGDFLRTHAAPKIMSIGIMDPLQAAAKFGDKRPPKSPNAPSAGILKANWLQKHRGSRPGVAVLLVQRQQVTGDPGSWARLVAQMEAVKGAARPRGVRVMVVVVQAQGEGDLPDDRAAMICRQAGVDKKCLLTLCPGDGAPALAALARVIQEQCLAHYAADAQRRLGAHAGKVGGAAMVDGQLRVAFKLGVLAEFRGDWAAAVHMFQEAYNYVPQVAVNAPNQLQRFVELRTVAEFVHVKLLSVLLLALKRGDEAAAQLDRHLRIFKRPAIEMPPGLLGSHHGWVCRQYVVMAELLTSSGLDLSTLKREYQPGELYLAAARAAIARRRVADFIRGVHGPEGLPQLHGQMVAGQFVGQFMSSDPPRRLSDEEFVDLLEAEECRAPHSRTAQDLLRAAHEALLRSAAATAAAGRGAGAPPAATLRHVSMLLGQEQMEGGDPAGALALLEEVAAYYRRAGWAGPLLQTLLLLRECTHRLGAFRAHAAYSLEAASLEDSSLDPSQRAAIAAAALMTLLDPPPEAEGGGAALPSSGAAGTAGGVGAGPRSPGPGSPHMPGSPAAGAAAAHSGGASAGGGITGLHYAAEAEGSGWGSVVRVAAGFLRQQQQRQQQRQQQQRQGAGSVAPKAGGEGSAAGAEEEEAVQFGVALWNALPVDLPLAGAEVALKDERGSFWVPLLEAADTSLAGAGLAAARPAAGAAGLALAALLPGHWRRLVAAVPVRVSGPLTATWVRLRLGPAASLALRLPQGAGGGGGHDAAQSLRPPAVGTTLLPFPASSGFKEGQHTLEVPPRHSPPLVTLSAPTFALDGEAVRVAVTVQAQESITGARLAVRAFHRETQQPIPVSLAAQSPPLSTSLATSPKQQQQQQHGGRPVGEEGLLLGDIPGGAEHAVVLEAAPQQRSGQLDIRVQLTHTCHVAGASKPEGGKATVGAAVPLETPFRFDLSLLGPPHTHTLLQAPAVSAQPLVTSASELARQMQGLAMQDSFTSIAAERSIAGERSVAGERSAAGAGAAGLASPPGGLSPSPATPATPHLAASNAPPGIALPPTPSGAPLPSQLGPAAAAAVGSGQGVAAVAGGVHLRQDSSTEAGVGGGPGAAGSFVLPAGQRCTAVVTIRNHAPCELGIVSVALLPPPASEGAPAPAPAGQLQAPSTSTTTALPIAIALAAPAASNEDCAGLHKADAHTSLFLVSCPEAGRAASLGSLVLRWRRMGPPAQQQHAVRGPRKVAAGELGLGGGERVSDCTHAAAATPLAAVGLEEAEGGVQAEAGAVLESAIVLPPVAFLPPLLTATLSYPPSAAAGTPLAVQLQLANGGGGGLDVSAAIKEAHGFVLAGPKSNSIHVLPHSSEAMAWHFVPTHSGVLRLPNVAFDVPALGHGLEVAAGCELVVDAAAAE